MPTKYVPAETATKAKRLATRHAAMKRWHPEADLSELERAVRIETLAQHIERVVSTAPGITHQQAERLAALLRPGDAS